MKKCMVKASHYESGPNMTPLVDIVMVILIFLMLTGTFGAAAHFLPSANPHGIIRGPRPPAPLPPSLDVYVSTRPDGSFSARLAGGESFSDPAALGVALDAKRASHESAGTPLAKMQVVIHPRLNTRYQHVTAAYEAALAAKWPKVAFGSAKD